MGIEVMKFSSFVCERAMRADWRRRSKEKVTASAQDLVGNAHRVEVDRVGGKVGHQNRMVRRCCGFIREE